MKYIKSILRPVFHFFTLFFTNRIISYIPFRILRNIWLCMFMRMKKGKATYIDMGCYFIQPWNLKIGNFTHINQSCILDSRGGIEIGNSVSISHRVNLVSASHDINSQTNIYKVKPIKISDYVFIGVGATILQGVEIGTGAVVCANACVTKNVPPYSIVAGVPATIIGTRSKDLNYKCNPETFFC